MFLLPFSHFLSSLFSRSSSLFQRRSALGGLAAALALPLLVSSASATTFYVNAKFGHDTYTGLTVNQSFLTINKACQVVKPGDTVLIAPGVYFGNATLWTLGTPTQPITFQGQTRLRNTEVISCADPSFRSGAIPWTLTNATLNTYSAPCSWLPARVLYNDIDLYPYTSLANLSTFTTDGVTPGPHHGFFYDSNAKLLYVRLNPKYGSLNPAQRTMMVGAPNGGGDTGKLISTPTCANFIINQAGSGNVIFDGLTFETPGVAGIATKANDITVQNCYFIGCRTAVYGLGDASVAATAINNVVVQYCEYSLFPAFDDMSDEIETAYANPSVPLAAFFWWQRKTIPYTYELGFVLGVGANWKIRNNYLHDVVDAISGWGTTYSVNLEVSNNVIARTVDNAVECGKNHMVNMLVHDNIILDSFEAITYQPMEGTPWAASITVSHNVIADTGYNANPWKHMPWERGAFKFVIDPSNWVFPYMTGVSTAAMSIPGTGFTANNNTVLQYNGNIFTMGGIDPMKLSNVHMINNLFVSYYSFALASRNSTTFNFSGFDCQGNTVAAPGSSNASGAGAQVGGPNGHYLQLDSQANLVSPTTYNFSPASNSPLLGAGVPYSGGYNPSTNVGAYGANGQTTLPAAGIQPDSGVPTTIVKP
jgi:hypothetical protein